MDQPQIYQRLAGVFAEVFDDDAIVLTPELSADQVDGWDSLTHVRLMMTVQKAFKIKFSASEIGKLQKVGDLVKLIQDKT